MDPSTLGARELYKPLHPSLRGLTPPGARPLRPRSLGSSVCCCSQGGEHCPLQGHDLSTLGAGGGSTGRCSQGPGDFPLHGWDPCNLGARESSARVTRLQGTPPFRLETPPPWVPGVAPQPGLRGLSSPGAGPLHREGLGGGWSSAGLLIQALGFSPLKGQTPSTVCQGELCSPPQPEWRTLSSPGVVPLHSRGRGELCTLLQQDSRGLKGPLQPG